MWIQLLCACVLYSYGSRGQTQWVVTSISHMGEMRDSDWSRPNLLRSDWLPIFVAIMTTSNYLCVVLLVKGQKVLIVLFFPDFQFLKKYKMATMFGYVTDPQHRHHA